MKLPGPRPHNAAELRNWLESYHEWQEALVSSGLYTVDPSGSSVHSNHAGRPTESMAVHQANLSERCRVVNTWLGQLSDPQWWMAQRYVANLSARGIARQLRLPYDDVAATIRLLPALIYLEWYGSVDRVSNPQ